MNTIYYSIYILCIGMLFISCRHTLKNGKCENNLKIKKREEEWTEEDERIINEICEKRRKNLSLCILFLILQFSVLTVIAYL